MQNQFQVLQESGDESAVGTQYSAGAKLSRRSRRKAKGDLSNHSLTLRTSRPGSPFTESASATSSPAHHHRLSDRSIPHHTALHTAPQPTPEWLHRNASGRTPDEPRQKSDIVGTSRPITTQLSSNAVLHSHKLPPAGSATLRNTATHLPSSLDAELQSWRQYLGAESHPEQFYPKTDVVWGQTQRDKVYNFLLHVPYQLERVMWYGCALCFDSFLACLTSMPWRAFLALLALLSPPRPPPPPTPPSSLSPRPAAPSPAPPRAPPRLQGSQLFDLVSCLILVGATGALLRLDPGAIYFSIKDIISEFLKIHVVSTALELFDKILSNFGVDALEALSGTCTLWALGGPGRSTRHLLADTLVAFGVTVVHASVLMCQAILFSVAMTSKNSALLALLIASNFVEIKGTVYKRMDVTKLWNVACMDVVERMHLVVVLAFVVVEDLRSGGGWTPSPGILPVCLQVVAGEVVIDVIKHAVLGKFNDIRPGVYREFMKDLSEKANGSQSYNVHKHLGFHYMACAALGLRMIWTLLSIPPPPGLHVGGLALGAWVFLAAFKPCFGYVLKVLGFRYMRYYSLHHGSGRGGRGGAEGGKGMKKN